MNKTMNDRVRDFRRSAVGFGYQLRNHLAQIIVEELARRNWSQKDLAQASGKSEPYISRLIHSDANFRADVAGEILHALEREPAIYNPNRFDLVERSPAISSTEPTYTGLYEDFTEPVFRDDKTEKNEKINFIFTSSRRERERIWITAEEAINEHCHSR